LQRSDYETEYIEVVKLEQCRGMIEDLRVRVVAVACREGGEG